MDVAQRLAMGEGARARIASNYTLNATINAYQSLYASLLNRED
jgi:glycosyltransferase involved in cell wall biosynthesis